MSETVRVVWKCPKEVSWKIDFAVPSMIRPTIRVPSCWSEMEDTLTGLSHAYGAAPRGHSVQIPLWPDTHGRDGRFTRLLTHLDGPLHLLDVLKILQPETTYDSHNVRIQIRIILKHLSVQSKLK